VQVLLAAASIPSLWLKRTKRIKKWNLEKAGTSANRLRKHQNEKIKVVCLHRVLLRELLQVISVVQGAL